MRRSDQDQVPSAAGADLHERGAQGQVRDAPAVAPEHPQRGRAQELLARQPCGHGALGLVLGDPVRVLPRTPRALVRAICGPAWCDCEHDQRRGRGRRGHRRHVPTRPLPHDLREPGRAEAVSDGCDSRGTHVAHARPRGLLQRPQRHAFPDRAIHGAQFRHLLVLEHAHSVTPGSARFEIVRALWEPRARGVVRGHGRRRGPALEARRVPARHAQEAHADAPGAALRELRRDPALRDVLGVLSRHCAQRGRARSVQGHGAESTQVRGHAQLDVRDVRSRAAGAAAFPGPGRLQQIESSAVAPALGARAYCRRF